MRCSVPFVLLIALVACRPASESDVPDAARSTASTASSVDPIPTPSPSDAATQEMPEVTLSADGIILIGAVEGRGTATTLQFGRDKAAVLDVLAVDFGTPKMSRLEECGAGAMEFAAWGPLTLNFLDGRFVGWRAERGARVVTVDGLRLGNTLAEVKHERSAQRVPETTLDGEFKYASGDGGTIGGFLEGPGDSAKVVSLHAGVNCIFR